MSRELPTYRLQIEQLNRHFPDRELLSRADIMSVTGVSLATVRRRYPFKGPRISKVNFAYMLAKMDRI